jgi:hypothetical protein
VWHSRQWVSSTLRAASNEEDPGAQFVRLKMMKQAKRISAITPFRRGFFQ